MKFWTLWLDFGVWRFKGNDDLRVELWIMNVELQDSKQWGIRLNLLYNPYLILTLNLQGFPCTCFLVEPYDLNVHNAYVGTWSLKAKGQMLMLDNFHTLYSVMWIWIVCRVEFGLCSCIIKFKFNKSVYGRSLMELGGLLGGCCGTLDFGAMPYESSSFHECGFCYWGIVSRSLTLHSQWYEFFSFHLLHLNFALWLMNLSTWLQCILHTFLSFCSF